MGGFGFTIPALMDHFFGELSKDQADIRWSFVARGLTCFVCATLSILFGSMALVIIAIFAAIGSIWYYRAKQVKVI